jgi:hypothetical protein
MLRRGMLLVAAVLGAGCARCSSPEASGGAPSDAGLDAADVGADSLVDSGNSGPVDAGEDIYGIDFDDGTFLTDKQLWTPVPDNDGCGLFVGKVMPDPFPKREWKACGPGCLESDALSGVPGEGSVLVGGTTAEEIGGELFLRATHGKKKVGKVMVTSRLGDGATLGAIEIRNGSCGFQGWANGAALLFPVFGDDPNRKGELVARGGRLVSAMPGAAVTWGHWLHKPGPGGSLFAWDEGWGTGVGSSLLATTSLDDKAFKVIVPQTSPFEVMGRGKLLVWPAGGVVASYATATGPRVLWSAPKGYVASVTQSDTSLVWIVVDGPLYPSKYTFETAQLYHAPLTADPSALAPVTGPTLGPAEGAFIDLRTSGDIAASKGCHATSPTEGSCPIFVAQLSTGKVWQIPPRSGMAYQDVLAVSNTEILVSECDWPGTSDEGAYIRRFLRFSTSSLDALEKAW